MYAKLLAFLNAHPGLRRVIRTFLYSFLTLAIPGGLGWLGKVSEWANTQGTAPFPDTATLGFVAVSALVAGLIAIVNAAAIWIEDATGKGFLRGEGDGILKKV